MPKATDQLLKDHKMIRKVLQDLSPDNPRFPPLMKTLQRIVIAHAWFEDKIFLPAFEAEPLLHRRFTDEIRQEHQDIETLLRLVRETPAGKPLDLSSYFLQLVTLLETHFKKEEDALFPLAERILDEVGLNRLGEEMERRKTEVRGLTDD